MNPQARRAHIVAQAVGDELVIYDERRHTAHRLNRTAAEVWRLANGRRSIADLAALLARALDVPVDEAVIYVALDQLQEADLLVGGVPAEMEKLTRRRMIGELAALLPVVASVALDTPVQAFTPIIPDPPPNPDTCPNLEGTYSGTATLVAQQGGCGFPAQFTGGVVVQRLAPPSACRFQIDTQGPDHFSSNVATWDASQADPLDGDGSAQQGGCTLPSRLSNGVFSTSGDVRRLEFSQVMVAESEVYGVLRWEVEASL